MFAQSRLGTAFGRVMLLAGVAGYLVASCHIGPARAAQQVTDYPRPISPDVGLGIPAVRELPLAPSVRLISPPPDEEWVEGATVTITWEATGPIYWVRLYYYGGNCPLGGRPRGSFGKIIADEVGGTSCFQWTVPWIDATCFRLRIAGFGANDQRLADFERTVRFRPRESVDLPDTCIAIIKRKQRLYYYQDGRIVRMHIISTAQRGYSTPMMKPGDYSPRRGGYGPGVSEVAPPAQPPL